MTKSQTGNWNTTKLYRLLICLNSAIQKLASVDVDADCQNKDSEETKKQEGVDHNGFHICFEVAKFHSPGVPWKLEEEDRGKQYEEQ